MVGVGRALAGLAFAVGLVPGVAAAQEDKKPPGPPPALVVTAPVERGTIRPEAVMVGTVRARAESLVATEVAGIVREVRARRGDIVQAGDVLAVLSDAEIGDEMDAAAAEVKLAEAELEKARADLRRAEDLVAKQVAPQEQLDATRRDAEVWQQRLAKARSALRLLEDRVARQTVRAPFTGAVIEEHAEVGEWVQKGGAVSQIADYATVLVRVPVPEQYVRMVSKDLELAVEFDAVPGKGRRGRVAAVISAGDPQARTFPVEIEVENPRRQIRPGMTGRVSIPIGQASSEILVPKDALVPKGPRAFVYAVADGKAVEVPVEVVGYQGDKAAVRGDIPPGAPVIVRGNERVRPGQPVRTGGS